MTGSGPGPTAVGVGAAGVRRHARGDGVPAAGPRPAGAGSCRRAPTTTRSAPLGGGEQRLEDRPLHDGGPGTAVHAGLGDRPEHLGLEPVVGRELRRGRARAPSPRADHRPGRRGQLTATTVASRRAASRSAHTRAPWPAAEPSTSTTSQGFCRRGSRGRRCSGSTPGRAPARTSTDQPTAAPHPGPGPAPGQVGCRSCTHRRGLAGGPAGTKGPHPPLDRRRRAPRRVVACVSVRRVICATASVRGCSWAGARSVRDANGG